MPLARISGLRMRQRYKVLRRRELIHSPTTTPAIQMTTISSISLKQRSIVGEKASIST
jgi:hypothetical protein